MKPKIEESNILDDSFTECATFVIDNKVLDDLAIIESYLTGRKDGEEREPSITFILMMRKIRKHQEEWEKIKQKDQNVSYENLGDQYPKGSSCAYFSVRLEFGEIKMLSHLQSFFRGSKFVRGHRIIDDFFALNKIHTDRVYCHLSDIVGGL